MPSRTAPRILQRYLLKELATLAGMSLLALTLLFMIVLGIRAVQGGYSLRIILPWIVESIAYSFYFTVPLSLLVAATLGYGRFVTDREHTAASACGISPLQLLVPILALSSGTCLVALATQGTILPRAHYKQRNITRYLVKQLEHIGDSKKGKLQIDKEDGMVYWDEIRGGRDLRGVHIEKRLPLGPMTLGMAADGGIVESEEPAEDDIPVPPTYISAASGILDVDPREEQVNVTLFSVDMKYPNVDRGYLFPEAGVPKFYDSLHFSEITLNFPINEKTKREGDLTNSELSAQIVEHVERVAHFRELLAGPVAGAEREEAEKYLAFHERRVAKARIEIWFRRSLALSVFSFGLLGFPICVAFRHSHRMVPFFIGTLLVVGVYYPLLLLGEALVKTSGLPAPLCMLSGNIVLIAVGGFLCAKLVSR